MRALRHFCTHDLLRINLQQQLGPSFLGSTLHHTSDRCGIAADHSPCSNSSAEDPKCLSRFLPGNGCTAVHSCFSSSAWSGDRLRHSEAQAGFHRDSSLGATTSSTYKAAKWPEHSLGGRTALSKADNTAASAQWDLQETVPDATLQDGLPGTNHSSPGKDQQPIAGSDRGSNDNELPTHTHPTHHAGRRQSEKAGHARASNELTNDIKHAKTFYDVEKLCKENMSGFDVYHATTAIHRMAKLIGIKRSHTDPANAIGRPEKYQLRSQFVQSKLYADLIDIALSSRRSASVEMLCLLLWGMASLRHDNSKQTTALPVKKIAKELMRKLRLSYPYGGSAVMLSQAAWALSQLMREDAPWAELFSMIGDTVMQSNDRVPHGPASAFLKAAATYKVLHGNCPLNTDVLDFLSQALILPDDDSPGPQGISQGLYALAKLGYNPGDDILRTAALILPTRISRITVDRQAVGNSMWALASLGFQPSGIIYKQMMQQVMGHCDRFLCHHFSQVFFALRMWELPPSEEQMQTLCLALIRNLPVERHSTENPVVPFSWHWSPIADELELLAPYYIKNGKGQVPALQHSLNLIRNLKAKEEAYTSAADDRAGSALDDRALPAELSSILGVSLENGAVAEAAGAAESIAEAAGDAESTNSQGANKVSWESDLEWDVKAPA